MNKSRNFLSAGWLIAGIWLTTGIWLIAGISGAALFGLFFPDRRFLPAFADGLMIAGAFLLSIAWIMHLRGDGLRFFPRRSSKDRLPEPGNAPSPSPPLPGVEGPDNEAYRRLEEAERKLRDRIAGSDSGTDKDSLVHVRKSVQIVAVAGVILFLLSLAFQYLIPALLTS